MPASSWLNKLWPSRRSAAPTIERAGNLEDPATPISSGWNNVLYGDAGDTAGVTVTPENALCFSPIWRGVNLVANYVAKLPCFVLAAEDQDAATSRGSRRDRDHPAYRLVRRRANAVQSAFHFRHVLQCHAMLCGNAYALIKRNQLGEPVAMFPLCPLTTVPTIYQGELWYVVGAATSDVLTSADQVGPLRRLRAEQVLHLRKYAWDGICGEGIVAKLKRALGLSIAQEEFAARYFSKGATPGFFLEHPGTPSPKQLELIRDSWNAMQQGLGRTHEVAIMPGGIKANPYSHNAAESQLLESRKFSLVDVANMCEVPVHKVGGEGRTAYNSLEMENQAFLDDCLDPWLVAWETECELKLTTEQQQDEETHSIEFLRDALERANLAARGGYFRQATGGAPWMTPNEVRTRSGLNPLPGGDELPPPPNQPAKPAADQGEDPETDPAGDDPDGDAGDQRTGNPPNTPQERQEAPVPPSPPPGPNDTPAGGDRAREALGPLLTDVFRRAVKRIAVHASKSARQGDLPAWLQAFEAEHRAAVEAIAGPALAAAAALLPGERSIDQAATIDLFFSWCRHELTAADDAHLPSHLQAIPGRLVAFLLDE